MFRRHHVSTLALAVICLLVAVGHPGQAEAGKKKKPKPVAATAVNAKAMATLMGGYTFGMSPSAVAKVLAQGIEERYTEKIAATQDINTQDKLRRLRDKELLKLKKSLVKFDGKNSGWDVSIVDQEFAHQNGEGMMVFWETDAESGKDQRRFFFFKDSRLYKMFMALNSGTVSEEQRDFGYFKTLMEQRFGKGKGGSAGKGMPAHVEWRSKEHLVRAVDRLDFYGNFCLVIAEPARETELAALRAKRNAARPTSSIIDAVGEKDGDKTTLDEGNANVIDNIIK